MVLTKDEIIAAAKALPDDERWQIIEELEATMPDGAPPMTPELRTEYDRRWDDYKSGKVKGLTWDEVVAQARQGLNADA